MQVKPYLSFEGRCEEALEFYQHAVGAKVEALMRFSDSPEPHDPNMCASGSENKVMHAAFKIGDSLIMASDGHASGQPKFDGCSLALSLKTDAEAEKVFAALSEGGQVHQPLIKTFFSSRFGMAADRFGVPWMIVVEA